MTAIWIAFLLVSCAGTELFFHLPIDEPTRRLIDCGAQARRIIRSDAISDHWKERVMRAYACTLGVNAMLLGCSFAAIILSGLIATQILHRLGLDIAPLMLSLSGMAAGSTLSILYYVVRRRVFQP